ncbi:tRNA-specific 2-thiouridylase [Candidatus Saccharibacteria bacterium]|nr:tRNA-specific 2-thiouridylase [Candidatus Saccharibacteria bacterium]
MKTVFVGMSGGVDSSVSALLLKEQGYNVIGVYMKNWSKDLPGMKCPWAEDLADAKRVAVKLGIDFEVWDFEEAYKEKVVEYMLREFRAGNTPNPDIMCNQEIKFKLFYEKAMERGADYIATGHYARVVAGVQDDLRVLASQSRSGARRSLPSPWGSRATPQFANFRTPLRRDSDATRKESSILRQKDNTDYLLARAVDENKDQTYFLYRISEEALAHTIFPIGEMTKPEVKKLAEKKGLHNAYKKESMGVCFVGEVGMKDFLKGYIDIRPGEIREIESEKVLGYHEGVIFYTIGQRHGLYLTGIAGEVNDGLPYYVVKKDIDNNIVYVSKNLNNEYIWAKRLELKDIVLRAQGLAPPSRSGARPSGLSPQADGATPRFANLRTPLRRDSDATRANMGDILVRLRHRAPLIPAKMVLGENGTATLEFENEVKRPAAGQSAVVYDGEICLGGGIIQ